MAVLYIYPKPGEMRKLELVKERTTLGRAQGNEVVVADASCSSRHATIERDGESFLIRDEGSKNGTFVNDHKIQGPKVLFPGDRIFVGSTEITFDRPRMGRVRVVDDPATVAGSRSAVPFREILDPSSAAHPRTSRLAVPADMHEENRILQMIVRVSEALGAHKPVPELLEDILDLTAESLPMDQCVVMLRESNGDGLETRAARAPGEWSRGREIQVSRTIVDMAFERHLAVLFSAAEAVDPSQSIFRLDISSALCVPIGDDEEVIGVLYADRHARSEPFKDADLRLLTLLASTAAVKIQQARQVEALVVAGKLRREIQIAADIQKGFLPHTLPSCESYDMAGRAVPCLDVGGDYFDCVCFEGERLGLAVADVSGKGVGAALLMASLRAWLRAKLAPGADLAALAERLNEFVHGSSDAGTFITFFYAELDRRTGGLRYVNAGHNPPVIFGAGGAARELEGTGLALGMIPGVRYEVAAASLEPGEVLALYTDGITESRDAGDAEFGVEGLADAVRAAPGQDAQDILETVFRRLAEFTGGVEPFDDRTLVVVKRRGFVSGAAV
jgi:sigma-B regulation protein RsbU (phosphoserine phosphatase)